MATPTEHNNAALNATVGELLGYVIQWRTEASIRGERIAALEAEIAALKSPKGSGSEADQTNR